MAVYSITDVEKLTGIRAHTLRAWEQRFELVVARRGENNVRYYLEEDLRELYNIALLTRNGIRIGQVAAMGTEARAAAVAELASLNISPDTRLDALTLSTLEMNPEKFNLILDMNIEQRGFEETMLQVIYPFLDKLGVLYFTGSISAVQESFVGSLIRQKILAVTDRLTPTEESGLPTFLLFLPREERQELSMLFVQYLLKERGYPVVYLGTNVAPADLGDACRLVDTDYIFTIVSSSYVAQPVEHLVREIMEHCVGRQLIIAGYQAGLHDFSTVKGVTAIGGLHEVLTYVDAISKRADPNIALAK